MKKADGRLGILPVVRPKTYNTAYNQTTEIAVNGKLPCAIWPSKYAVTS